MSKEVNKQQKLPEIPEKFVCNEQLFWADLRAVVDDTVRADESEEDSSV